MNVTPEYLLSHGFIEYHSFDEGDCCDIPFNEDNETRHFRESELNRNLFVVLLRKDEAGYIYNFEVYIQINVGCGFVQIPFLWRDLSIEHFEALYFAILGDKPRQTGYLEVRARESNDQKLLK